MEQIAHTIVLCTVCGVPLSEKEIEDYSPLPHGYNPLYCEEDYQNFAACICTLCAGYNT